MHDNCDTSLNLQILYLYPSIYHSQDDRLPRDRYRRRWIGEIERAKRRMRSLVVVRGSAAPPTRWRVEKGTNTALTVLNRSQ